ncbi:MAG: DUF3667 domain-containing protein [Alistipes sp.]|nr:DUF3667 domain-containing protein [Alistipes sp.]
MIFRRKKRDPEGDTKFSDLEYLSPDIKKCSFWEMKNSRRDGACKNCGEETSGNYCWNCGQKTSTSRIRFTNTVANFFTALFNVERGALKTLWMLFTRPGFVARDYIEGKRKDYINPFSLMVLLAGIYGALYILMLWTKPVAVIEGVENWGVLRFNLPDQQDMGLAGSTLLEIYRWLRDSTVLLPLSMLPVFTLFTQISFSGANRKRYNYTELMYAGAFITSQRFIIDLLSLPFRWVWDKDDNLIWAAVGLLYLLFTVLTFKQLFATGWIGTTLRTLFMLLLSLFLIIILAVVLVLAIYWFKTGENVFEI